MPCWEPNEWKCFILCMKSAAVGAEVSRNVKTSIVNPPLSGRYTEAHLLTVRHPSQPSKNRSGFPRESRSPREQFWTVWVKKMWDENSCSPPVLYHSSSRLCCVLWAQGCRTALISAAAHWPSTCGRHCAECWLPIPELSCSVFASSNPPPHNTSTSLLSYCENSEWHLPYFMATTVQLVIVN